MRTSGTLFILAGFGSLSAYAQNSCSNAMYVTAGTYTVDAVNGPEIPVPLCGTNDVGALHTEWYMYTPDQDYSLTITTDLPQIQRVDYLANGVQIASASSAPWSASWNATAAGATAIHARVTHDDGRFVTLSPPVNVTTLGVDVFGDGFENP